MQRGDIVRFRGGTGGGHVQSGQRFGVVVQSDALRPLSTVIVAPTSTSALETDFRPLISIGAVRTKVLVEQLGAVDARRLGEVVGRLTMEELWMLDDAVATVVGLS